MHDEQEERRTNKGEQTEKFLFGFLKFDTS